MTRRADVDALERALREASPPDEGAARERVRRTVLAAAPRPQAATTNGARRRLGTTNSERWSGATIAGRSRPRGATIVGRRARIVTVVVAAALAVIGGGALTRPGQAVGEWLGEQLAPKAVHKQPVAPKPLPRRQSGLALPANGRLLVHGGRGLWIVARDGERTALGDWTSGSWSPHGLHVAVASGRTLAAVRPDGSVRWRYTLPARVADPRWAPDATHIAYRAGATLHVIWGNGLHDAPLPGRAAAVPPVWRPSDPHTLAWARANGTVIVQDAYTGLVLWHRRGGPVRELSWSADGGRLLIAGRRHGAIYDLASKTKTGAQLRLRRGEELAAAAFAPRGGRLALAVRDRRAGYTTVRIGATRLVRAPLRLRGLAWSPDARWLVAGWPSGDQWLLIPASGGPAVRGVTGIARRFGAATQPLGWCC